MRKVIVLLFFTAILTSCRTVPVVVDTTETDKQVVEVMQTQTEVAVAGKELEATIDAVKTITDDAKVTGEIPREKVANVIEYVDKSAAQVKSLNETIARQTGQIATLEKLRIDDNTKQGNAIANLQIEKGNVETARDTARKIAFYLGVICFGLIVFIVVYWLLKLKGFVK